MGISSPAFEKKKEGQCVLLIFAVFNSKYSIGQSGRFWGWGHVLNSLRSHR